MSLTIPQLLSALHQRLHGRPPDATLADRLEEIAYEDGLLDSAPYWLAELLASLAEDAPFSDRKLSVEQFYDRRYDVTDFFASLAPALSFDRMHDGEYMVLSFEPLGVSVCFDFEALGGGVDLRFMRWPSGPWPHWERWPPGDPRNRVGGA
jgi:hypothetical protein